MEANQRHCQTSSAPPNSPISEPISMDDNNNSQSEQEKMSYYNSSDVENVNKGFASTSKGALSQSKKPGKGLSDQANQQNASTSINAPVFISEQEIIKQNDPMISTPIDAGNNSPNKTDDVTNVKKKKRRRINRTGFPNKKRPKKKVVTPEEEGEQQQPKIKKIKVEKVIVKKEVEAVPPPQRPRRRNTFYGETVRPPKEQEPIATSIIPQRPRRRNTTYREAEPTPPPPKKPKLSQRRSTVFQEKTPVIEKHPVKLKRRKTVIEREVNVEDHPVPKLKKRKHKLDVYDEVEQEDLPVPKMKRRKTVFVENNPLSTIIRNKYHPGVEKKAYQESLKASQCVCKKLNKNCGKNCQNRAMCIECDVEFCGTDCTNTAITTDSLIKGVVRFETAKKGWGIRADVDIQRKQLIIEYTGEVMFKKTFEKRMQNTYQGERHHFCLALENDIVIDGHNMGTVCRFVNHSCKPNCKMAKVQVDGLPRMVLQADMDIPAGTELTYHYHFEDFEGSEPQTCYCGEDVCSGTISGSTGKSSTSVKVSGRSLVTSCLSN